MYVIYLNLCIYKIFYIDSVKKINLTFLICKTQNSRKENKAIIADTYLNGFGPSNWGVRQTATWVAELWKYPSDSCLNGLVPIPPSAAHIQGWALDSQIQEHLSQFSLWAQLQSTGESTTDSVFSSVPQYYMQESLWTCNCWSNA